ncbi:MAG: NifB/NifX family molybdenum-iron cluster-binding protein [Spirochaetaceae bacterium]|nr:NifB/NifX family molybdenum-iron cluster-binding protein [Spirochaetaceae bacterium]
MKLAFCIKGRDFPLSLDDRFGRSDKFCIVETRTGERLKMVENSMKDLSGSAGVGAVQLLYEEGVEGIVAPHLGPTAEDARNKVNMKLWDQGDCKNVDDALSSWEEGNLKEITGDDKPQGMYRA